MRLPPGAERPAGQAQASGFADQNGLILIPTPAQVGDIEEAIFHGIGAVSIAVSNDTTLIIEETLPPIRFTAHNFNRSRVDRPLPYPIF